MENMFNRDDPRGFQSVEKRIKPVGSFSRSDFSPVLLLSLVTIISYVAAFVVSLNGDDQTQAIVGFCVVALTALMWFVLAGFLRKFTETQEIRKYFIATAVLLVISVILMMGAIAFKTPEMLYAGMGGALISAICYFVAGHKMKKTVGDVLDLKALGNIITLSLELRLIIIFLKTSYQPEADSPVGMIAQIISVLLEIAPLVVLFGTVNNCRKSLTEG